MKSTRLSDLYSQVMARKNRIGLPHINIKFGNDWIIGKIGCSNVGYNFRGQTSTNCFNVAVNKNSTLLDIIL